MATRYQTHATPWQPIHGLLAAYPLALFSSALVTDIVYANTAEMMWANFSIWLITGGLVGFVLAGIAGIVDALVTRKERRRPRRSRRSRRSRWHNVLTIFVFVFALINAFIHSRDAYTSVVPTGLILSIVVTVLVFVTNWLGYAVAGRTGEA